MQGIGRYISMSPNGEYVYARLTNRNKLVSHKVDRDPYKGPVSTLAEGVAAILSTPTHSVTSASVPKDTSVTPTPSTTVASTSTLKEPVAEKLPGSNSSNPIVQEQPEISSTANQGSGDFHNRPPTRAGVRNQQDSSFSFSGNILLLPF